MEATKGRLAVAGRMGEVDAINASVAKLGI